MQPEVASANTTFPHSDPKLNKKLKTEKQHSHFLSAQLDSPSTTIKYGYANEYQHYSDLG